MTLNKAKRYSVQVLVISSSIVHPFTGRDFHKAHNNLCGGFILGVDINFGLSYVSLSSKVAYTGK